ncbi:hypothetical protein WJX84_002172 [Apatococcus fuscideae]|uniref:Uncharacterized protein n=1 Tax=Apatococcus fuscideae TaxID=2026836 RepID=A0AAW1TKA1_9CHLO
MAAPQVPVHSNGYGPSDSTVGAEMIPSPHIPAGPSNEDVDGASELLMDGARFGDLEDVTNALELGINANTSLNAGTTALHMASANGHLEIVQKLVDAGADVNSRNESGNTPLHWACLNGQAQIAEFLLQHGANISTLNSQQRTPVDEVLGKDFQEPMLAVIDSFQAPAPPGALDPEDPEMAAYAAAPEGALR